MPLVIRQASLRPRNWPSRGTRDTRSATMTPEEAAGERCRCIHAYLRACDGFACARVRRGRITWTSGRRDHPCPQQRKRLPRSLASSYLLSRKLNSSRRSRKQVRGSKEKNYGSKRMTGKIFNWLIMQIRYFIFPHTFMQIIWRVLKQI